MIVYNNLLGVRLNLGRRHFNLLNSWLTGAPVNKDLCAVLENTNLMFTYKTVRMLPIKRTFALSKDTKRYARLFNR